MKSRPRAHADAPSPVASPSAMHAANASTAPAWAPAAPGSTTRMP
jgi:hypothetical protein